MIAAFFAILSLVLLFVALFYTIYPHRIPKFVTNGRVIRWPHTLAVAIVFFVLFLVFSIANMMPQTSGDRAFDSGRNRDIASTSNPGRTADVQTNTHSAAPNDLPDLDFDIDSSSETTSDRYAMFRDFFDTDAYRGLLVKYEEADTEVEFSGRNDSRTKKFKLEQGFVVLEANYTGDSTFFVYLQSKDGNMSELLVGNYSDYKGRVFALIWEAGEYYLDIETTGDWSVKLTQSVSGIWQEGETIEGSGDEVIFVDMTSGWKRFEFTHDQERHFAVFLNGERLLVNEIGPYSGSNTAEVLDDSIYALVVNTIGNWTVKVEPDQQ